MKSLSVFTTSILAILGTTYSLIEWIFKDKSLEEIKIENRIKEVKEQYENAISEIRNGKEDQVEIPLKNGDVLTVKSMK